MEEPNPNNTPEKDGDYNNDDYKQQRRGIMTWYNIEYNYDYDHDYYPDPYKHLNVYDIYWTITFVPTLFTSPMKHHYWATYFHIWGLQPRPPRLS